MLQQVLGPNTVLKSNKCYWSLELESSRVFSFEKGKQESRGEEGGGRIDV
jgi:hypothetical protein